MEIIYIPDFESASDLLMNDYTPDVSIKDYVNKNWDFWVKCCGNIFEEDKINSTTYTKEELIKLLSE